MNLEQLGLQLGIAGALMVLGYRLAIVFIERWGKVEDKKTDALANGFKQIVDKLDAHTQLDMASHTALVHAHSEMAQTFLQINGDSNERFARLEGLIRQVGTRHDERLRAIMMNLEMTPPPTDIGSMTLPPTAHVPRARSPRPQELEKEEEEEE